MKLFKKLLIFFLFCQQGLVFGASSKDFNWSGNLYKKMRKYRILHKNFSKQVCNSGADFKYYKLLRKYRGQGNYLPLYQGDIDRKAILVNLGHIKKKISYIDSLIKKLKKKDFPKYDLISKDLDETVSELLVQKKKYFAEVSDKKKLEIVALSGKLLKKLQKQYDIFLDNIFFIKSYGYPNNHLQNRFQYEKYKVIPEKKNKANKIFFYRKIVEDGTYNSKHQRSDLYTRSTLDTLYYKMRKQKHFISENVRNDLEWTLKNIERFLDEGKSGHLKRLKSWKKRTKESYDFYRDIIKQKNREKAKKLVQLKNEASINLKKYVYKKQAEVYEFWVKQNDLMKSLYVLETILFNEVGTVDGKDGLERKDVAQVVMNRYLDDFYSSLDPKQELIKYLELKEKKYEKEKWLNTLFRIGEFSFTYHYISSVVKIFCPDMSRRGKSLRNKNLKISLKAMKNFKKDYKAIRYFSRISMLGKIDMSSVWTDYIALPEKPGYEVGQKQRKLERLFHADKYQFLYNFKSEKDVTYQVVRIKEEIYTMTWIRGRPRFYKYRNPHLFTYFKKK